MSSETSVERASKPILTTTSTGNAGNKIFFGLSLGAGWLIMIILAAVAAFLIMRAAPAFTASAEDLESVTILRGGGLWNAITALLFGTVLSSLIALLIAVPLSIGVALFISHYAPRKMASMIGYVVDILAAIPSVVFGLWGARWLLPILQPAFDWLSNTLAPIPVIGALFAGYSPPAKNIMAASIVLAVMILPIITATIREVFLQTPRLHEEASLALGATRWEMVRMTVFPFGRSGIISASMLGLGRALGETMAVLMILSPFTKPIISWNLLAPGNHSTIAANIASNFPEARGFAINVLIATGLMLFILTFVVNMIARAIIARRAEFSGAN